MKVLIVGGGGREHTLAWALSHSPAVDRVYTAPGNAGTALVGENLPFSVRQTDELLAFAQAHEVGLTLVGPELPLIHDAIVDKFRAAGQRIYGPTAAAARLEGSKAFADEFLAPPRPLEEMVWCLRQPRPGPRVRPAPGRAAGRQGRR